MPAETPEQACPGEEARARAHRCDQLRLGGARTQPIEDSFVGDLATRAHAARHEQDVDLWTGRQREVRHDPGALGAGDRAGSLGGGDDAPVPAIREDSPGFQRPEDVEHFEPLEEERGESPRGCHGLSPITCAAARWAQPSLYGAER